MFLSVPTATVDASSNTKGETMSPKTVSRDQGTSTPPVPTVTIYQNGEYISGILQQLYRQPLAKQDTTEDGATYEQGRSARGDGGGKMKGKVGWLGSSAEVEANITAAAEANSKASTAGKRVSVWEYTQAYYLHAVKETLRGYGMLKSVATLTEAGGLCVGDVVEFTAQFEPDQMSAFLDVLTPELVSAIVRYQVKQKANIAFDDPDNFLERQKHFDSMARRIDAKTELAEALTRAVRTDFRSEGTREFFGRLGDGEESVTAVTMCDHAHFTVEDTDRILDGRFTVLAKVVDELDTDRPALERNKLLSAIDPKSIDYVVNEMRSQLDASVEKAHLGDQVVFDPKISARIDGASFKVIPIAIYV